MKKVIFSGDIIETGISKEHFSYVHKDVDYEEIYT